MLPPDIPLFIEANNRATEKIITKLTKRISSNVHKINSEKRFIIHLAAVFANNFTNHLLSISGKILEKEKIPFSILRPMIEQATARLKNESPSQMQTGPAFRGDNKILSKHIKYLKDSPELKMIYQLLSDSIQAEKRKEK